jgi:cell division protein FtsW
MQVDGCKYLVGISFQPPLSQLWYYLFCSKVFVKTREEPIDFVSSLKNWLPVFVTLMFILPSNFSTTALILL